MEEFELKAIGERIRAVRTARNLTQAQLAEALNVSPPYLSNIEQGKQAMGIKVLRDLCDTLDVSADWILRNKSKIPDEMSEKVLSEKLMQFPPKQRAALERLFLEMKSTMRTFVDSDDEIKIP